MVVPPTYLYLTNASDKPKEGTIFGSLTDVAKTFDSVPHEAILQALRSQGVDEHTLAYIRDMYSGIRTPINGKASNTPLGEE
jgi:hypothetical protein